MSRRVKRIAAKTETNSGEEGTNQAEKGQTAERVDHRLLPQQIRHNRRISTGVAGGVQQNSNLKHLFYVDLRAVFSTDSNSCSDTETKGTREVSEGSEETLLQRFKNDHTHDGWCFPAAQLSCSRSSRSFEHGI